MRNYIKEFIDDYKFKRQDKFCAPLFKRAADKFKAQLEACIPNTKVTEWIVKNEYFIFDYGENSIIHFQLDSCPGWWFGVWWKQPKNHKDTKYIRGQLFAQYETTLDKFKPSASVWCVDICVDDTDDIDDLYFEARRMIEFIKNEPELAFCRDYCAWDYNYQYHTRAEARKIYQKHLAWYKNKVEQTEILDKIMLDFIVEKIVPVFKDCKIHDLGEGWSPRYDLVAKLSSNLDLVDEAGCYSWFEDDDKEGQKLLKEYKALEKSCKKVSDKYKFIWYSPIGTSINFVEDKYYED